MPVAKEPKLDFRTMHYVKGCDAIDLVRRRIVRRCEEARIAGLDREADDLLADAILLEEAFIHHQIAQAA